MEQNGAEQTRHPHAGGKKSNCDIDLEPFTRVDSKGNIDLNVKCKTKKLLEDSTRQWDCKWPQSPGK